MAEPERGEELLDEAFDRLEAETPDRITNMIRWLRSPRSRRVRLPVGILCIIASFFWFLPVIGVEFFPIGLLLIAQDVPFLQRPVARWMLWLEDRWVALRRKRRGPNPKPLSPHPKSLSRRERGFKSKRQQG